LLSTQVRASGIVQGLVKLSPCPWHLDDTALPALVDPLVANRINTERVVAPWDDLLRVGASIHEGAVLPSLLWTKLQAFLRQNALARALQDYGRLVKTLFILRYLQQPELRKRVGRQLNKGRVSPRAT
jgi:TnpA family transposase